MDQRWIIGFSAAIPGMGVRVLTFAFGWDLTVATEFYLLIILVSVFFGIRRVANNGEFKFTALFRGGLQTGIITTILISLYTYFHYKSMGAPLLAQRIADRMIQAKEAGLSEEDLIIQQGNAEFIFSASTHATLTLAAFLIVTLLYSLITAFLYQKVNLFSKY